MEMAQRNAFGATSAAAGMQDQCDVIGAGRFHGGTGRGVGQGAFAPPVHRDRADGNIFIVRGTPGWVRAGGGAKQHLRVGIPQKKQQLFVGISRIQRSGRARNRRRQKADNRRQAVGHRQRHDVAAADAGSGQRAGHLEHLPAQRIVGNVDSSFGNDYGRAAIGEIQNVQKSACRTQCHSLLPWPLNSRSPALGEPSKTR